MNNQLLPPNLKSTRSRKARLALRMKRFGFLLTKLFGAALLLGGAYLLITGVSFGYVLLGLAIVCAMWAIWYKTELTKLPPNKSVKSIDDVLDQSVLAKLKQPLTPRSVWQSLSGNWEEVFITNRLLIDPNFVADALSENPDDLDNIWQMAMQIQNPQQAAGQTLRAGPLTSALILSSPAILEVLAARNIKQEDVIAAHSWLDRIVTYQNMPKPYFGGIGRDWAFGFTPMLERYSSNISRSIQLSRSNSHFMSRSKVIDAVINGLDQTGSVAIVGDYGIGKTSAVYALAQRLLEDRASNKLRDHQIVNLNASVILSEDKHNLENIMLHLFAEAIRAGNMILFLDDAQLFFQEGTGSFDMSRILMPILQNRRLKLITTFSSTDYQRLKTTNPGLTSMLNPVVMQEPSKEESLKIIEDAALNIEFQTKKIVSFEAVKEAYRLSEQYIQDSAFPGKAIKLLEQSAANAQNNVITALSVQKTIEQTLGVKATAAQAQEAQSLLQLEDRIHSRMVNQIDAVRVVSSALRRSRAGVGSSNRPIGSFLFLGPTGVGKTELAKSLAATVFDDEANMIRLDMSEYQQASDASRLLDPGSETDSLLLKIRKQPFSVVLLDEIEKAHESILNLLLQLLDEGQLTDTSGKPAAFQNAIIIATSNAGSSEILNQVNTGQLDAGFKDQLINNLISAGTYRAELINRFDEIVLFKPLGQDELKQVALLMMESVNKNLANQNIQINLTDAALLALVDEGYDPQFGARPMRRTIQRRVEDTVANRILSGQISSGATVTLDVSDLGSD